MPLLTYSDLQPSLNIDLTDPNGQTLATELIAAAVAIAEGKVGYALETAEATAYFEDGYSSIHLPTRAPVSAVALETYNSATRDYDAVSSTYIRFNPATGEVLSEVGLPAGFMAVKATFTAGWSAETLPADLKKTLVDITGLLLQAVTNYATDPDDPAGDDSGATAGALKRVQSGPYTEEYAIEGYQALWKAKQVQLARTIGDDLPAGIQSTFERYRRPVVV